MGDERGNKKDDLPWFFRYPFGIGAIWFAFHLYDIPKTSGWVIAGLVVMGLLMMYEALILVIFGAICFFFLRALAAVPVTLATLFWLWLLTQKN